MNQKDIRLLYEYNRWANARVLDSVSALTQEQLTIDLSNSHRSVQDTLLHLLSSEWIWLMRWKGISPPAMLNPADFADLDSIKAKWTDVEHDQTEFVSRVSDQSLQKVIAYVNTKGEPWRYPLWQIMQHVVNHSSYHRGQVTTLLRQLGAEPAPTDYLLFFDEKSEQAK